jgi:hypothetical protein
VKKFNQKEIVLIAIQALNQNRNIEKVKGAMGFVSLGSD